MQQDYLLVEALRGRMDRDDTVEARFDGTCERIGFPTPPLPVHARLVPGPGFWSLYVRAPAESFARVTEWLNPLGPARIEFGPRNVLRADFRQLLPGWETLVDNVEIQSLVLLPEGRARLSVRGSRAAVQRILRRAESRAPPLTLHHVAPAQASDNLLTPAQQEALVEAVNSGYYRVPRPLNLQMLAARLHVSSASLSERLRRAEGRVLTQYVESGFQRPWDSLPSAAPSNADDLFLGVDERA